jgi:DNA polymerase-3 subunit beta
VTVSLLSFETKRFVLHTLAEKAASALAVRDLVPQLKNFQVVVGGDSIQIAATDMELAVVASTEAVEVRSPGTAVFPGRRFLDLVREAEDGDVVVEVSEADGLSARVDAGRASWVLRLADPRAYPALPAVNGSGHPIDKQRFVDAISKVRYAAATDTVRAPLMLVNVARGRMQASDGVRFHQVDVASWWPSGFDVQIPIGAVEPLVHLLRSSSESHVAVGSAPDHIVFRIGQDTYIVSKSAARFPEIEDLLVRPALENETELRVGRADLIGAIRRTRIAADLDTQAVSLGLRSEAVEVSCRDKVGNVAREEIPANWEGQDRSVAFNQHHLIDMLQASEASVCRFLFGVDTKRKRSPILMQDDEQMAVLNQVRV